MKQFFTSRGFKLIAAFVCVLLVVSIVFTLWGNRMAPQSDFLGTLLSPIQKLSETVTTFMSDWVTAVSRMDTLEEENNQLREEIRLYRQQLIDYDDYKRQNQFYSQFLEIKEQNPHYAFQPATVTARDGADAGYSFTIDAGSRNGVALHDPVITQDGLVGYISQLGTTMSTVTTVLDPSLKVGALVSRTSESGIVHGDAALMNDGHCMLSYLSGTSTVTVGDYVISSGSGGVFPQGLIIGTVTKVQKEQSNVSLYGEVAPVVDIKNVTQVMVITDFEGQGGIGETK